MIEHILLTFFLAGAVSCTNPNEGKVVCPECGDPPSPAVTDDARYPVVSSDYLPARQQTGDMIPDFSRVGYRWGDADIPRAAPVKTLEPPANGADATSLIQNAIDQTASGVILLKKGVYKISGVIKINKSGIVLRGEGNDRQNGTVLIAAGTTQRDFIQIGGSGSRSVQRSNDAKYTVKDSYVPAGRFWVRVNDSRQFNVGDNVVVYRPSTEQWISDLRMDRIPDRADGGTVNQWAPGKHDTYAERVITMINGDTLHFENPVVMSIDAKYGGGRIFKYSYSNRICECGVEDMYIESEYSGEQDEEHAWNAVAVNVAEHCWIRNVTSRYFGMGLAAMNNYSKNITVINCTCLDPVSTVAGSRRYSFHISQGQLCLVKNCTSDKARHDFATGALNCGPNVFTNCTATNTLADIGPHQRWNTGTLYDNVTTDGEICVQDRSNYGTGQGWAGANNVLWNCTGRTVIVQNPWVSAYNYSIGTIGAKSPGKFTNPLRPDGVWLSNGTKVSPALLYEAQLLLRKRTQPGGIMDIR